MVNNDSVKIVSINFHRDWLVCIHFNHDWVTEICFDVGGEAQNLGGRSCEGPHHRPSFKPALWQHAPFRWPVLSLIGRWEKAPCATHHSFGTGVPGAFFDKGMK